MSKRIALILSLLPVVALTGCNRGGNSAQPQETTNAVVVPEPAEPVPPTPPPLGPVVGHVSNVSEGENAFVGPTKATVGLPIHLNEHFYTGPGTKMEITLEDGRGTVWLDQLTDPNFFTSARCFWIRLTKGTMAVTNKDPMCAEAGLAKSSQHSYVLYQANGETTTIAVLEGEVTTITPPGYTVRTGQILTVQNGATTGPQPMDQDTINRLQAWIPRIIL
jgi:hypothetical protein